MLFASHNKVNILSAVCLTKRVNHLLREHHSAARTALHSSGEALNNRIYSHSATRVLVRSTTEAWISLSFPVSSNGADGTPGRFEGAKLGKLFLYGPGSC